METTPARHPREQDAPQVGASAPLFTLPDEKGQPHALAEALRAGKPVVLFFMRGEW
ncbi:MAG: redoxin domain-containing protein [Chloroflexi bacterium]|nr:redoxin domain-containing protein [Chloroflexota bacterium]